MNIRVERTLGGKGRRQYTRVIDADTDKMIHGIQGIEYSEHVDGTPLMKITYHLIEGLNSLEVVEVPMTAEEAVEEARFEELKQLSIKERNDENIGVQA